MSVRILVGDNRQTLSTLESGSVQTCVTSPPYFGLRDYGVDGQIGMEPTPDAYVAELVAVFREVRRVLKDDGTLWLNLGDSFAGSGKGSNPDGTPHPNTLLSKQGTNTGTVTGRNMPQKAKSIGLKPKDLIGIPWRVAFALQADGWYLRSDIIWHKPNPMPESVTDRPTKSHEYLFLLAKSERYYYDADEIAEESTVGTDPRRVGQLGAGGVTGRNDVRPNKQDQVGKKTYTGFNESVSLVEPSTTRNKRTVWTVNTAPFKGAHFATFPPALIEPCILAGAPRGGMVLDPFGGAGTTGLVADRNGRDAILCELNPAYADIARKRIADDNPLFTEVA